MNYATLESFYISENSDSRYATVREVLEQASALEAFAEMMQNSLCVLAAVEADINSPIDTLPADIGAKFTSGFKKIEDGKKSNNSRLVAEGQREIAAANAELQAAEKNASSPEEKKKLSIVAKIAIAVGGAALLTALTYVGVKNKDKILALIKKLKKNPGNNVAQVAADVNNAATTVADPRVVMQQELPDAQPTLLLTSGPSGSKSGPNGGPSSGGFNQADIASTIFSLLQNGEYNKAAALWNSFRAAQGQTI